MLLGPTLSVSGMEPGRNYAVQTSTDLVSWETRWTVPGGFTDRCYRVDGSGTPFFYRVLTLPRLRATRPPALR